MIFQLIPEPGLVRDAIFLLRALTVFLNFYLAFIIGRRVKEAGFLSATMGFALYLGGTGMFEWGLLGMIFYGPADFDTTLFFQLTNVIFLLTMAAFPFFAESDQARFQKTTGIAGRKKFPYTWTVIAMGGIVLFFMLFSIDPNLSNFAFIYLVFPLLATSGDFLNRFNALKFLKEKKPALWFIIGMTIAGFSNFITSVEADPLALIIIQAIMAVAGSLCMVRGWNAVPALSELQWYLKLNRLMAISRESSIVLFSYDFQVVPKERADTEEVLASGALSGIQTLLGEILQSKQGINEIDHGDKTIYFQHGEVCTFVLFTQGKAIEFNERLIEFKRAFEKTYGQAAKDFKGYVETFSPATALVKNIFHH